MPYVFPHSLIKYICYIHPQAHAYNGPTDHAVSPMTGNKTFMWYPVGTCSYILPLVRRNLQSEHALDWQLILSAMMISIEIIF